MPTQPTTNNLEGWEEKFDKAVAQNFVGNNPYFPDWESVKQFIKQLRQKDCEELIKFLDEDGLLQLNIEQGIKEYYNK